MNVISYLETSKMQYMMKHTIIAPRFRLGAIHRGGLTDEDFGLDGFSCLGYSVSYTDSIEFRGARFQ